ncbi:Cytidylate kinase [Planococcus massiliensis]|uniref:Cytidylate kinase n=1 Tax=Planococcus massiliensis TaxID=1499687 RepID=A0A098EM18_9BACL|nr:AAA family ATPase [Planococcus massiliensis]CEG22852.1 Cytidylate kinase [Planococcus massiliensis]
MKIYITGSVGSGKTTLAKHLATELGLHHFETDNFVWKRAPGGDIRNSVEQRNAHLAEALMWPEWIVEGVHMDWTDAAIDQADWIIFLDIPLKERKRRIIKRFLKQIAGAESANYKPTFKMLQKMFTWNRYFEEKMKPVFVKKFHACPDKAVIATSSEEALRILSEKIKCN